MSSMQRLIADRLVRKRMNINENKELKLTINDPDNELQKLFDYIRELSVSGHSFDIVVDPHDEDRRREFFIDGDGSTKLANIEEVV